MWYVYVLQCRNNALYTGITTDPERRFKEHLEKSARYTSYNPPLKIAYQEEHPDRSSALKREYQIKSLKRKEKLILLKGIT